MYSIVLKNFFNKFGDLNSQKLYNESTNQAFRDLNIFKILNIIGKNKLFAFAIIMLILFGIMKNININLSIIFSFVFVLGIYYIYFRYNYDTIVDFTRDKEEQLYFLNTILSDTTIPQNEGSTNLNKNNIDYEDYVKESFLYINPMIIEFYYVNRRYITTSYHNFRKSLQSANDMIALNEDIQIGIKNKKNQYEMLLDLQKDCLNYFQSVIYGVSSTNVSNNRFQNSIKLLHEITNNIVNDAAQKIKEQNEKDGYNTNYYPIYQDAPKPNDTTSFNYNNQFDFFT